MERSALRRNAVGVIGTLLLASTIGCGGATEVDSGLSASISGGALSAADATTFCEALESYAQSKIGANLGCKSSGVQGALNAYVSNGSIDEAGVRSACEAAESNCKTQTSSLSCSSASAFDLCTSTVGELEDCFTAHIDSTATELEALPSCGELTLGDLESLAGQAECTKLPKACSGVATACESSIGSFGGAIPGVSIPNTPCP